ncbi:pentatricopeptide repeat-containing protein At5g08510 [Aristolochia californica]|uniref:pentatricopeptide repeat-containing protein At5g08510 n=1 Tax=Aristolochia californica TaxID=171875 RepID=UPI0035DC6CEA
MNQIKQIHAHSLRSGVDNFQFLILKLLAVPNVPYARKLFDLLPAPSTFLCNKLLQAYSALGPHLQCLSLFSFMRAQDRRVNAYSFTFLFVACAAISAPRQGQGLHANFIKLGFPFDAFVYTSLQDMYSKTGLLDLARQLFEEMPEKDLPPWNSMISGYAKWRQMEAAGELFEAMPRRNVVSWTSMVSGYAQNGMWEEALGMFLRMEKEGEANPNEVTLASVLPACANLGALDVGERIGTYARERGFLRNVFVSNALLEMYAKCGRIDQAREVFEVLGRRRNACSWNSMIMGLAVHGRWREALDLFHEMLVEGVIPDDITFVAVLLACTHGGMVDEGWRLFDSMEKDFLITPKLQHYGCMVDLLGRAGHLTEAYNLIKKMPMDPDSVVWGTLLGACSFHSHVELAETATDHLFELEPSNPGNFVILSNIYASAGRWDGVAKMRILMKENQIRKEAGYSIIVFGGLLHKFLVEDRSHSRSADIYEMLGEVTAKMKLLDHIPDSDAELHDFG